MSYHYGVPPAHYTKFKDPVTSDADYVHYVPNGFHTTPRRHSRKQSHHESPQVGGWYSPAGAPPPYGYAYNGTTPRKDYVSYDKRPSPPQGYGLPPQYSRHTRRPSQPIYVYESDGFEYAEPLPRYVQREPSPSPPKPKTKTSNKHGKKPSTDKYFFTHQGQVYDEQPRRSRARANTATKTTPSKHRYTKSASNAVPQATEKDAMKAGIPSGYSIKNWDPTEKPIILLGSVFDANSLGKWIYDWTVFHHGASTPIAEMAGDLWLLLIKLAGKMKRAEETIKRVRLDDDSYDMIQDFIRSGNGVWARFKALLKESEYYMMKVAKREGSKTMGRNAGTEFVDSIFGRDRYLKSTEVIMASVHTWNTKFDENCEEILRPSFAA